MNKNKLFYPKEHNSKFNTILHVFMYISNRRDLRKDKTLKINVKMTST